MAKDKKMKLTPQQRMSRIGTLPITKILMEQTGPNMISLMVATFQSIIVSIFIGRYLGKEGLSAQSVFATMEGIICSIIPQAFSVGATSYISPALGRKDVQKANNYLTQLLYSCMFYSVLIPVVFVPWLKTFLSQLGAKTQEMLEYSYNYSFWMLIFGPLVYSMNHGFMPLFRSENRATTAMVIQICSSIITIVLSGTLFPFRGQQLKLTCAVTATIVALFITGVFTIMFYFGVFKSVMRFVKVKLDCKQIWLQIAQSIPQILNGLPSQLGAIICNVQISKYSKNNIELQLLISSVGIVSKLSLLILQIRNSFYLAFLSIFGYHVGAKMFKRIRQLLKVTNLIMLGFVTLFTVIILRISDYIVQMFTGDAQLISVASLSLRLSVFAYPLGCQFVICTGIYQMEKKPYLACMFQAIRLIATAISFIVIPLFMDIQYVFLGFGVGDSIAGLFGIVYYFFLRKRYARLAQEEEKFENVCLITKIGMVDLQNQIEEKYTVILEQYILKRQNLKIL